MSRNRDPLDDIGSLVEQARSLLTPSQDEDETTGYSKIGLDTPSKNTFTLEDVERSPDNVTRDPLSPVQLSPMQHHRGNMDLTGMHSVALNSDYDLLSKTDHGQQDPETPPAAASPVASHHDLSTEVSEITAARASAGGSEDIYHRQHAAPGITISVKVPERTEVSSALGLKSGHWDYVIRVDSSLPGLVANGMEVKRRFSEFDALSRMLHTQCRGYFIPPLPPKSLIGIIENSNEDFLRLRRADLQAFLRAVAAHPVLQQTEVLRVFLLQPGDLSRNPAWLNLCATPASPTRSGGSPSTRGHDAIDPRSLTRSMTAPTGGAAALANLGNWMSWMKQSTLAVFQPPKRELPPDEAGLRQAKEMLQDLGRLLQLATASARAVCQDLEKMSSDLREFGVNMGMLCKYEETIQGMVGQYTPEGHSASNRAADFRIMAKCQAKQCSVWKTLSLKCAASLVKLHDYMILMPEAIRALEDREAVLEQVFSVEEELAQKKHQLEQLQGAGSSTSSTAEKRVYLLSQSIDVLEEQVVSAREQYELIKARNQSELSRVGLEREADFRRMMFAFTANQAQLVQSSADMWAQLARQYGEGSL